MAKRKWNHDDAGKTGRDLIKSLADDDGIIRQACDDILFLGRSLDDKVKNPEAKMPIRDTEPLPRGSGL